MLKYICIGNYHVQSCDIYDGYDLDATNNICDNAFDTIWGWYDAYANMKYAYNIKLKFSNRYWCRLLKISMRHDHDVILPW